MAKYIKKLIKFDQKARLNMSIGQKGKSHSQATKEKISRTLKLLKPKKLFFCLDCKKQIFRRGSIRCCVCAGVARRGKIQNRVAPSGINHHNYRHGKYLKNYFCLDCRIPISSKSGAKGSGLCKSCVISGKRCPLYIDGNGYRKYPKEFKETLKTKIRTRDNYNCQNCGMTSEEHIIVYGREIEVHHIDHNRNNCDESNLITLCKQDNLRANKNIQYWIDFYREKNALRTK